MWMGQRGHKKKAGLHRGGFCRIAQPALEDLEGRIVPAAPIVSSVTPDLSADQATLVAGIKSIKIIYSSTVTGGSAPSNYDLRNLGIDGIRGTSDDIVVPLKISYSGSTASLSFSTLPARSSKYELTVSDSVTNAALVKLDGDVNGAPGGNFVRSFTIVPDVAKTFAIGGPPSVTAGAPATYTVTALDAYGNIATGYSGTVHITSSDGSAVLPADFKFSEGDAGVRSFSATLFTAGNSKSVSATDTTTSSISGKKSGIVVSAAEVSKFVITAPTSGVAGDVLSITVTAKDIYANVVSKYAGKVSFSSTDARALLPSDYTFVSADAGVHTFTFSLRSVGSHTITATDVANGTVTGKKSSIKITAAAANSIVLSAPSAVTVGTVFSVAVTVKDAYGNVASGYAGKIHFSSNDVAAGLPADYSFTASDAGIHTFKVTLKSPGSRILSIADLANGTLATSLGISVAGSTLNPNLPPAGNFNLSSWNLTLPSGPIGQPSIISTRDLVAGYSSEYFYTGADGAMVFWAPVTGAASGTSYPRSELRETRSDGSLYNWNLADGTATLRATLAVNQMPSTGKLVVGQIHSYGGEPLIKLVYDTTSGMGTLRALIRPTPGSPDSVSYTLATGLPLDSQFSYQIELKADFTLSVQVNGVVKYSALVDASWATPGLYFKAGAYTQDNVGLSSEGGRVSFYALSTTHT